MTPKWLPNAVTPGTQRSHPLQPPFSMQQPSTTASASMTKESTLDSQFEQLVALAQEIVAIGSTLGDDDSVPHGRSESAQGILHKDPIVIRRHLCKLVESGKRLLEGLDEEKGRLGVDRYEVVAATRAMCVELIFSYTLVTNNQYPSNTL